MNFRNISAWCIRNPVVPLVLFIGLMLAGMLSFSRMEVQDQPDIEFPAVRVFVTLPGAAPKEVETQITQRIEAAVRSINGIDSIGSTASEGSSATGILFDIGTDVDVAVSEVKNAVDQIRGELPDGILEPQVVKIEGSGFPFGYFSVAADDMTVEQLSWFVDDTIAKRLLAIPGMATVERSGGVDREIVVTLEPARMQSLGITAGQVNLALRGLNLNAAGGKTEIAGTRQSVRVLGNAADAYALSQTEISLGGGRTVKLTDVGTVEDKFGEIKSIAKNNGKLAVTFSIARARGASDVTVYDAARAEMAKIEKEHPGVHITELFTSVGYTKEQYESSISAMVEGAILAVIVVFFFLRDWRATMISALAIPLSAIPAFWFLRSGFGITLNQMSLMALGLVAGVLVDDAIVESENIVRHMRMGKSAYQASIDAADEIGLAVVATTFSIVAVFLPVALMSGIPGQFFFNFGMTVVVAVLTSLAVARMITPMVAAYFLKAHGQAEHGTGRLMDLYDKVLRWSLDTTSAAAYKARALASGRRINLWRRFVARLRDHRVWMLGLGLAALIATGALLAMIPKQLFPQVNSDFGEVGIEMVPGTTLAETERVADQVAAILFKDPDVALAPESIREGSASLFLTYKDDRKSTSQEIERRLTPKLQEIPDARVTFVEQGGPGSGGGAPNRPIVVMLTGADSEALDRAANQLLDQMRSVPGIVAPRVSGDRRRPEIVIKPRLDLAASMGVSTSALSQAIRVATLGEIDQNAAKFSLNDRQVPIRVKLSEGSRRDVSTLQNLPVPTAAGGSVPLASVADITFGSGPVSIQRYNQQRRTYVSADLSPGVFQGEVKAKVAKLPLLLNLPQGVGTEAAGGDRVLNELVANFITALASAVLLVFAVLVLLYHRIVSPMVNMGSLFLAPFGGLIALLFLGQPISLPVFIGILMLFGIVAKNSILLIDFAIEEMTKGANKYAAIVEAGHKRAQPIVMTTVAMTAGMIPTAVSVSGDGAWRAPMGTVVIGGLILSTLLTLLIVPAGFSLAAGIEKRVGPWMRRKVLADGPTEERSHPAALGQGPEAVPAE